MHVRSGMEEAALVMVPFEYAECEVLWGDSGGDIR